MKLFFLPPPSARSLWPFAFVPWLLEGTKTVIHECPRCGKFLGRYKCHFGD